MVHGLEHFKNHFKDFASDYVLIGGVASHILLDEVGAQKVRPTKDLDVIVFINSSSKFIEELKKYIKNGGYKIQTDAKHKASFYRFQNPTNKDYPIMLELFTTKDQRLILSDDQTVVPIVEEDGIKSLSAILLDNDYYSLIKDSTLNKDELSIIDPSSLIVFKAKAYLDIKERGEDSKKWKKHRSDIINLSVSFLTASTQFSLEGSIRTDFLEFLNQLKQELTSDIITGACKQEIVPKEVIELLEKNFLS